MCVYIYRYIDIYIYTYQYIYMCNPQSLIQVPARVDQPLKVLCSY